MSYNATGGGAIVLNLVKPETQNKLRAALLERYDHICQFEMKQADEYMRPRIQEDYTGRKRRMKRYDTPFWWIERALSELGFSDIERNTEVEDGIIDMEMSYDANYWESELMGLLDVLAPFTVDGCITFTGEDEQRWRLLFSDGEWIEQPGEIRYFAGIPIPPFERTQKALEDLIAEVRRQAIYDDRPFERKALALLNAFEEQDPDGVLLALTGRSLYEHGAAAGIWPANADGKGDVK